MIEWEKLNFDTIIKLVNNRLNEYGVDEEYEAFVADIKPTFYQSIASREAEIETLKEVTLALLEAMKMAFEAERWDDVTKLEFGIRDRVIKIKSLQDYLKGYQDGKKESI